MSSFLANVAFFASLVFLVFAIMGGLFKPKWMARYVSSGKRVRLKLFFSNLVIAAILLLIFGMLEPSTSESPKKTQVKPEIQTKEISNANNSSSIGVEAKIKNAREEFSALYDELMSFRHDKNFLQYGFSRTDEQTSKWMDKTKAIQDRFANDAEIPTDLKGVPSDLMTMGLEYLHNDGNDTSVTEVLEKDVLKCLERDSQGNEVPQKAPLETDPKVSPPSDTANKILGITVDEFADGFDSFCTTSGLDLATPPSFTRQSGKAADTITINIDPGVVEIMLTLKKGTSMISAITLLGNSKGNRGNGQKIMFSIIGIMAAVDPTLTSDDQLDILHDMGMTRDDLKDGSKGETTVNGISYSFLLSKEMGLMFFAEPEK